MVISIVTVCRNSAATLDRTIESVLAQDYGKIEYIIIDGASTDATVETAKRHEREFAEKGYAFRMVSEPDKGIYNAMNKGAELATGEYIAFLNSSDAYLPGAVSTAAEYLEKTGADMFYASLSLGTLENGNTFIQRKIKQAKPLSLKVSRRWNHPTTFVRTDVFRELGGFAEESIYDDWDFVLRLLKKGKKTVYCKKVLAEFTLGGESHSHYRGALKERIGLRYGIYRRNGYSRLYLLECILTETVKYLFF